MKTILRSLLFISILSFYSSNLMAQCTVSDIFVQNIRNVVPGANTCTVTFDVTFNIQNNNGNKYIFIHTWIQSQYPNYFDCVDGKPSKNGAIKAPKASDLVNSFLNIGIDNSNVVPTIITSYPADAGVTLTTGITISKTVLPDGSVNFTLQGITTTVPVSCGTPTVIVADLWSSQAASAQVAHCVNCGIRSSAGYITVAGLVNCTNLTYSATVTNNTGIALNGYYRVYADVNLDGYFTPIMDTLLSGPTNYIIPASSSITVTGTLPGANLNQNVFIIFTQTTGTATGASRVVRLLSTQCSPLPVTFRTFTAKRNDRSNVGLRWETATEINNRGFALQRNTGNNSWETIAFIQSLAKDGNSDMILMYTYNDVNATKGLSQYRIQQVDIDGKAKYSEIRSVRGEGQRGETIVYPNPSLDGRVNIVFEEKEGIRDAILMDMSGRVMRQWKITNGNTIYIDNLRPGIYSLKIVELVTREQSFKKIVVAGAQ